MSTYTRREYSPQRHYNRAGQRHGNVSTHKKHTAEPNRKVNMTDQPFPNKPISHRRPPRTQVLLDSRDYEKITVSTQPRDTLPLQQHHTSGIRETNGSWHSRIDSHVPSRELQMAQAIQEKERMLQEKLWQLEGKIKQKIQRDSADTAAGDDQKSGEERSNRRPVERGKAQTKTRISELQRKEPVKNRDMSPLERRREDLKQPQTKQRIEGRVRNTHEVQHSRWEAAEISRSRGKGNKGTNEIIFNKQEVSRELTKLRWQDVKEHTRRKEGGERDYSVRGGAEKTKYRKHSEASMGSAVSAIEKKFREMTHKETNCLDDELNMPQKTVNRRAMENHRGAGRKLSRESDLPQVDSASRSSQLQQEELALMDNTDSSFQLFFPCKICNRTFFKERLEKHVQVCKKVKQSHRQVFNSYMNRTRGSAIEEYLKTHSRSKTPEVLKKKTQRQNYKGNISNLHQDCLPAGTSHLQRPKSPIDWQPVQGVPRLHTKSTWIDSSSP